MRASGLYARSRRRIGRAFVAAIVVCTGAIAGVGAVAQPASAAVPPVRHVFNIVLENTSWESANGAAGQAAMPYLHSLESSGIRLDQMFGVDHFSLANYIAMTSGYESNALTRADCLQYNCIYESPNDQNIGDQLEAGGFSWKGYMESMPAPCTHPATEGAPDPYLVGYATRHNPFMYYRDIVGDQARCDSHDVPYTDLATDLAAHTVPNYSFIVPDTCDDAHDGGASCGLAQADSWLAANVPAILASPEYQADGMLVITFDESAISDTRGCCGDATGGRMPTIVLSPFVQSPGRDSTQPYSHYSLLRTVEDAFGLPCLRHACDPGAAPLGDDVFGPAPANDFAMSVPTANLIPGKSVTVPLATSVLSGTPQPLALSVTGATSGLKATAPATTTSGKTVSVKVTASTAVSGDFVLTLAGSGGGASHMIPLNVHVSAPFANGTFESGALAPWTTAKTRAATVVAGAGVGGSFAARTGNATPVLGNSSLSQLFTVPTTASALSISYNANCVDAKDFLQATLHDFAGKVTYKPLAKRCVNTGGGFATVTFSLSAVRGKSVKLTLVSHDDGLGNGLTVFWDNVTVS